jgi:hypothetical protein
VRNYEEAIQLIVLQSKEIDKLERSRPGIIKSGLSARDKEDKIDSLDNQLELLEKQRIEVLRDLVAYPPHFLSYGPLIEKFRETINRITQPRMGGTGSVFIMTKYPDGKDAQRDAELQKVIDTVKAAVKDCGFYPNVASEMTLNANLWQNAECQMLACSHGIAIVDGKFKPELNPNVAMEWGWMRAMDKPVLYLVERGVEVEPADVVGLIKTRFDWLNPEADIPALVAKHLQHR